MSLVQWTNGPGPMPGPDALLIGMPGKAKTQLGEEVKEEEEAIGTRK